MSKELTVYRRSQLEDSDCLYRWNELWNKGVDDSSDYSIRGQAFAHIKHLYVLKLAEAGVTQDYELSQDAFIEGIAEHQTPQRLLPELRELWVRHAEWFQLDLDRYLASEEREVIKGVSWASDLVYAHPTELEIRDDKTYWTMLTESEVRASFQARTYARLSMERWPNFQSYRFTMVFVRFNKIVSVTFSSAELIQVDLELAAARARLEHAALSQQWPAVAGPSCRYCELQCPLVQMQARLPVRLTTEQAPQVAALVLTADKMVRGLKKLLKAHCAAHGPVAVGDMVFNSRPVTNRKYPLMAVVRSLQDKGGFGGFDDMTLSHSALQKVFKTYPDLEKELAPLLQEKTTFRFGGKRPGDDEDEEYDA